MSEHLEQQKREEQRLEAEKLQKKQLFAQRVAAAASVAAAVGAAQTTAEVERMRREASAAAEATARHQRMVEIQQVEMAERQEQMAEDQRLTNFRQTILTTLPLLKDGEKSQYLIEQLMPAVNKRHEFEIADFIFGDILNVFKFSDFAQNYFSTEPEVNKFMIEGKNPKQKLYKASEAYEKASKELEKVKSSPNGILALVVVGILVFWVFICVEIFFR